MDAFTENILARARERQRMLQGYAGQEKGTPLKECNKSAVSEPNLTEIKRIPPKEVQSETNLASRLSPSKENVQGFPGSQTKTLNIQRDNFNMEIKVNSAENVRVEVEIEEQEEVEQSSDNGNLENLENGRMREESRNRLKRLGKLYAGGEEADISSPIHRTEAKFYQSMEKENETVNYPSNRNKRPQKGLNKLASLADTINQWEDDLHHPVVRTEKNPSTPKKTWKPPAPQPPLERQQYSPQKSTPSRSLKPKAPSPPTDVSRSSPKKALFREQTFTKDQNMPESPQRTSSTKLGSPRKNISEEMSGGYISPTKNLNSPKMWTPSSPTKSLMESPQKGQSWSPTKKASPSGAQCVGATPKKLNWDKKVLDTLESQGYTRTKSSSRLIYSYNSQDQKNQPLEKHIQISRAHIELTGTSIPEDCSEESEEFAQKSEFSMKGSQQSIEPVKKNDCADEQAKNFRSGGIANRAALFEQKASESPVKPTKDPALLSLSERKALFEKVKGEALVPKAAFGMSAPVKVDTVTKASESKFIGASKNKETAFQASKSIFDSKYGNSSESFQPAQNFSRDQHKTAASSSHTPKAKYPAPPPPPPMIAPKVAPPQSKVTINTPTVAVVHQSGGIASKLAALLENKSTISEEQIANKVKEERQREIDMLLNRFNKNKVLDGNQDAIERVYSDQEELSDSEYDETDEETAMLKGKAAAIVSQNPRKSAEKRKSGSRLSTEADSPHVVSVIEEVKRIKVSPPKAGRLYPNLSDIEATTTDQETRTPTPNEENSDREVIYDSDDPDTSFGREILQTVCKNITPARKVSYKDSSSGSENSSVMDELDEILEEMEDDCSSIGPTPPKQGRRQSPKSKLTKPQQSNSFHYKSFSSSTSSASPSSQKFQSPKKSAISPRQSTELPLVVDGDELLSLTHTVSFYRKQQNEVHNTPVRQIVRQPIIEETSDSDANSQDDAVPEKIRELQREVNKQQNIISQTSQALNLCSCTPEFSGSTEQVEAERVLLVAMHRRQAALHELQRLKVEGTIRPLSQHSMNVPLEKGTLTISGIVLPLKRKYVTALAAGGKGHHVVCLIKCGEQVVPTKLVSTVASNSKNPDVDLDVPGSVTLNNIYSDFAVTFEVYCLQAQEECLPHEVKYHINKKGLTTPKKNKQESRLQRPPKESPAGPQAVRTSSFALMGYVVFSVQAVNKRVWSLNNTPPMSPLEGSVEMKIHCELAVSVEHRAFLTMFEDVTGFGAWHRRWFLLKGHLLSYWKYPEDERKKPPIDTIDLKTCITKAVGPVSRDICARLHTFLLERERPAYPQDKDTLVVVRKGDKTIIRHLLSADTKEERIEWCQKLNASITALRMWGTTHQ